MPWCCAVTTLNSSAIRSTRSGCAGHGDIQVADYRSEDREGGPVHLHPWDEAQVVVEGVAEFRIGADDWVRGGSG